jgi:NADH-quinone oxidoreductase subunit M
MVNHGLSTSALFLLVGMVYDRYHTRQLDDLGGLAKRLPLIAVAMVFISMASIGLPGLNGFTGEVLSLAGMFRRNPLHGSLGTTGVVLGAWYMLTMLQQAFFGPLREPAHGDANHKPIKDMNLREFVAVAPICVLVLWIGVTPQALVNTIRPDVDAVVAVYEPYLTGNERVVDAPVVPTRRLSLESPAAVGMASFDLKQPTSSPEL